jgi:hypothetical protein
MGKIGFKQSIHPIISDLSTTKSDLAVSRLALNDRSDLFFVEQLPLHPNDRLGMMKIAVIQKNEPFVSGDPQQPFGALEAEKIKDIFGIFRKKPLDLALLH